MSARADFERACEGRRQVSAPANQDMTPNRFARWADARKRLAWILAMLSEGRTVYVQTYTRTTAYKAKHADMFKATRSGLYVQRGRHWDCILPSVRLAASAERES